MNEKIVTRGWFPSHAVHRYRQAVDQGGDYARCDDCELPATVFADLGKWCRKDAPFAFIDWTGTAEGFFQ